MKAKNIVTHDGNFHADDVSSIAILMMLFPDSVVLRTRNPRDIAAADIRVDIGGVYDVATGNFDHHQKDFHEKHDPPSARFMEGPKKASTGLIWDHYGKDMIRKVLDNCAWEYTDEVIQNIFNLIKRNFIIPVDISDNNQYETFASGGGPYRAPSIIQYIVAHNPTWLEEDRRDETFFEAVTFVKAFLMRQIFKLYSVEIAKPKLKKAVEHNLTSRGILVLDEYIPWMSGLSALTQEQRDSLRLVVFPSTSNSQWMVQSPNKLIPRTDRPGNVSVLKTPTPMRVRGISGGEIAELTGVSGITFVHTHGFLSVGINQEVVLEFANWILSHQDEN